MSEVRIAIFASGTGSNADAIMEYFFTDAHTEVVLVLTNNPGAGVLGVAERHGKARQVISKTDLNDEGKMTTLLDSHGVNMIVLAGWLLLMPAYLVKRYSGRMVNIHPALLPKYGGKGMWGKHVHTAVKAAGDTESGITIHYVNEHYDEGAIIAQFRTSIEPKDAVEDIERKVRMLELEHYPEVVGQVAEAIRRKQ